VLDADSLGKTVSPTEDQLREYYEAHKEDYVQPEKRRASHILVSLDSGAGADQQKAALEKIEAARTRILGGEDFAAVAKEVSDDPGSAAKGGDLGFFGHGVMDPAFEQAAFAATQGEVTEPVKSQFGYHLILVREIQPEVRPELDKVRAQVEQAVRKQEAERVVADYAERLSNLSFEHPDSLEPAAEALGLKVQTSDWMSRTGGPDELASPEVVKAAFSDDVLSQGNNSEVIELDQDRMLVLRVKEHQEAAFKSLDEVRDQVVELVRKEQAQQAAHREADSLLKRLTEGATLEELQAQSGYELKKPGSVDRTSGDAPPGLIREVFKLPRPAGDAATFSVADLGNGDYAVVALSGVTDGTLEDLDEASRTQEKVALARSRGQQYYRHLVQFLRSEADIEVPKQP
jgi:peptidyl-prolyl cis-trans isomerase D